jgi:hypothetical protein
MHRISWGVGLSALLLGCQAPCPIGPTGTGCATTTSVAAATNVPTSTGTSVAPLQPAVSTTPLSGTASLSNGPLAAADVSLVRLGSTEVVATGTTDALGSFNLAVPTNQPEDALYRLTVAGAEATLVTVVSISSATQARRVLAFGLVNVNLATTLAYMSLQAAFGTLNAVSAARTRSAITVAKLTAAFDALVAAAVTTLATARPQVVLALQHAVQPNGTANLPASVAVLLTQNNPVFQAAFSQAAQVMAQAIQQAVSKGATLPAGAANLGITFGAATAPFLAGAATTTIPAASTTAPVPVTAPVTPGTSSATAGASIVGSGGSSGAVVVAPLDPSLMGVVTVGGVQRANAYVEVLGSGGFSSRTSSNTDGSYVFYNLAPGDYTLVVAVDGAQQSSKVIHVS